MFEARQGDRVELYIASRPVGKTPDPENPNWPFCLPTEEMTAQMIADRDIMAIPQHQKTLSAA
jgi:hypothetical protein